MSTLIYELAVVEDRGTHWQVTNVTKNTLESLANRHEKCLKLSYVAYKMMADAIAEGKTITIQKNLMTDEVLPHEMQIISPADTKDELQATKDAVMVRARMLLVPEVSKISGLVIYRFTIINNELASKGFFITDANREEQYLAILETGDETLIEKLEEYLNYRDELDKVSFFERRFSKFRSAVLNARAVDEVNELEKAFVADFYAHY